MSPTKSISSQFIVIVPETSYSKTCTYTGEEDSLFLVHLGQIRGGLAEEDLTNTSRKLQTFFEIFRVSRDFLIPTLKLASIVIQNNDKSPKMAIFRSQKVDVKIKLET